MNSRLFFLLLFALLLAARMCHLEILWAEETLPLATAEQMRGGKTLYRDVWFDKPPLLAAFYALEAARAGWLLRLAGSLYAVLICWLGYRVGRDWWGAQEGLWAAGLLGFFLTFYIPSAVIPLAADLLMLAPHLVAVYLAWRRQALWSGVLAGVAFLFNPKGLFVLAACVIWSFRSLPWLVLGFALPSLAAGVWLWWQGALAPYYDQVWKWGRIYAAGTFVSDPLVTGLVRTLHWLGFHGALIAAAAWFCLKDRAPERWRWAAWTAISFAAVAAGWRFFPRYYFQLLPPLALAAARGCTLLGRRRCVVLALLLVPLIRFGPRYGMLARDLISGNTTPWADVAMDRDSREAAQLIRKLARPEDTLFVWGFRPELYVYTGLPAASRFLDSQPLTGVPADRHLTESKPVATGFTAANRGELAQSHPAIVLDGLGTYNPKLAIESYEELRPWLARYQPVARTQATIIYRLLAGPAGRPLLEKR